MKCIIKLCFIFLLCVPQFAMAYSTVTKGKITYIENGWFGEGVALKHSTPTTGCQANDHEYAISADHPSYQQITSLLIAAFTAKLDVELVVLPSDCLFGKRTRVLSIRLIDDANN